MVFVSGTESNYIGKSPLLNLLLSSKENNNDCLVSIKGFLVVSLRAGAS